VGHQRPAPSGTSVILPAPTLKSLAARVLLRHQAPATAAAELRDDCPAPVRTWDNSSLPIEAEISEWLDQHPAPSPSGRCAWCGRLESLDAVVVPFGTVLGTHAWLHPECWSEWHKTRREQAGIVLKAVTEPERCTNPA
jgi:hypothetical protein